MRVLHVITALEVGGAQRMLLKLVAARATAAHEHHVVAMLPAGPLARALRDAGAQVHELDFLGGLPVLQGSMALARIARACAPDLVQGWLYHGNLGASLARASLRRRVPLVWGIRQSLASLQGENAFAKVGIALNRMGSRRPERVLYNSRTSLDQHRAFGFDMRHAQYIPNGFETRAFAPDADARSRWRGEWRAGDETVVFGMVARYHPAKDHAGFIEAARRVHAARPGSRFVLAGPGVDAPNSALMQAVRDTGLPEHVVLLGERRDVASILAGLDVYVSSSAAIEAFSNSVGEAMSCALPCVVTDVGDSPLVVGDAGRVVPPRDPAALADAMIGMIDLGPEGRARWGAQARGRVVAEYDIEAVAQRYADLYADLYAHFSSQLSRRS